MAGTNTAEGVGYINQDLSKTFNFTFSEGMKNGDCIRKIGTSISSYLDSIFTNMGFIRADNHGDHSKMEINFPRIPSVDHTAAYVDFVNVYRLRTEELNFLTVVTTICYYHSDGNNGSEDLIDNPGGSNIPFFHARVFMGYTRTLPVDGTLNRFYMYQTDGNCVGYRTYIPIKVIYDCYNAYTFSFSRRDTYNYGNGTLPLRRIKNNYYDFISLNNDPKANPTFGVVQVKGKNNQCYWYGDKGTSWDYNSYWQPLTTNITNLLVMDNEKYSYGTPVLLPYSFVDLNQKMPLVPVFCSNDLNSSTTSLNFDEPIMGIMQTSTDYAGNREVIYKLNNKIYRNLGNRYILEEGDIPS